MKSGLSPNFPYPITNSPNSDISTPMDALYEILLKKQVKKNDISSFPRTYHKSEMEVNSNNMKSKKKKSQNRKRRKSPIVHEGRWSSDEHRRAMKALSVYGNAWGKVRRYVGTRSRAQIRSHLQKHFLRQRRDDLYTLRNSNKKINMVFLILKEYRNMQSFPKKKSCNKQKIPKESIHSLEKSEPFSPIPLQSPSHYDNTPFLNNLFESIPLHGDAFQGEFECNESIKEFKELELETSQHPKESSPLNWDAEYFFNSQSSWENEE